MPWFERMRQTPVDPKENRNELVLIVARTGLVVIALYGAFIVAGLPHAQDANNSNTPNSNGANIDTSGKICTLIDADTQTVYSATREVAAQAGIHPEVLRSGHIVVIDAQGQVRIVPYTDFADGTEVVHPGDTVCQP